MLKSFNNFIFEVRGFSTVVEEYSNLCIDVINKKIDEYQKNLITPTTREKDFKERIVITDAKKEVSERASSEFPLNNIEILLELTTINEKEFGPYSGYYKRNYNKYKIRKAKEVNIEILCKIFVPLDDTELDRVLINTYLQDIFNHELMHAFHDFKDPNFLQKYRLGVTASYAAEAYPYLFKSPTLKRFFDLLYVLTDAEIKAIVGERKEFRTVEELINYSGYMWATLGQEYDSEEYREAILLELEESPYLTYLDQYFGEFFVKNYKKSISKKQSDIDPKIISLQKDSNLLKVLDFFEPYIKERANILKKKLLKKVTQQGKGRII